MRRVEAALARRAGTVTAIEATATTTATTRATTAAPASSEAPRTNTSDDLVATIDAELLTPALPLTPGVRYSTDADHPPPHMVVTADPAKLRTAIEAGLPVIAIANDDTRPLVAIGGGYLVPPGDPQAIHEAVTKLARMAPAARRIMGRIGRNTLATVSGRGPS